MQKKILAFLKKGILLSPDILEKDIDSALVGTLKEGSPIVIDSAFIEKSKKTFDETYTVAEVPGNVTHKKEDAAKADENIEILDLYEEKNAKISISDFVNLYNDRYKSLQFILRQRQELESATSIRKVQGAGQNEKVAFIGIILDIAQTKNNNLALTIEDQTGIIKVIVNKGNKDAFSIAKDLTFDEVIGVQGMKKDTIVFANNIINPDIPLTKELKKAENEEAALFISDLHIGSKSFLKKSFETLIGWICQENGSQKELVSKIKYFFILGDIVDGIGVYPDQEKDLEIKDIYEQYSYFTECIKRLPQDTKIIICPGNHDSIRVAEPQPPLPEILVPDLYKMKNVFLVSSPSIVRIAKSKNFSGLDVLIYHGFSFPYYSDAIESIRSAGGLDGTENIMTYLLKKRHLAPTHGSTQYQLGYSKDPLVIRTVPDFFVSGHIHKTAIKNYRNITLINSSCWISQTDYQEKRGLVPEPSRAIYVNLKTREPKILNFEG